MTPVGRLRRVRWGHPVLLCAGAVVLVFGSYEILERLWILQTHPEWCSLLHRVRGIAVPVLSAGLVAWYLLSRAEPLFPDGPDLYTYADPRVPTERQCRREESLRKHSAWLVQMRWAVLCIGTALVLVASRITEVLPRTSFRPLALCLGGLLLANIAVATWVRTCPYPRGLLLLQMLMDLVTLGACLVFSGGIRNPFAVVTLFHVTLAAVLLPRREAFWVAGVATLLLTGVAAGEAAGVWSPVPLHLSLVPQGSAGALDPLAAAGRVLPLVLVLLGVAVVASSIMERLRAGEAVLGRAAQMAGIGELAGRVAHEVNNPAGVIKAKARLLQMELPKGLPPERLREELDKIAQQAGRIGEITQGLLTFSRPSLGEKASQDLNAIVTEVLGLVDHTLKSAGIRLARALPEGLPPVCGNRGELRQVLLNLVTNAIDAMPTGGVLNVETSIEETWEGTRLRTVVQDTGGGIRPEDLDRIFLPFFTTKPEGKGTGLGLSVSQGLVRSHGGEIEVESAPGRGSRFTVCLPVSPDAKEALA